MPRNSPKKIAISETLDDARLDACDPNFYEITINGDDVALRFAHRATKWAAE